MAGFSRTIDKLDTFLSWWERLVPSSWNKAVVGVILSSAFAVWARLSDESYVVITTVAVVIGTCGVLLFTWLPLGLRKYLSPPVAVIAYSTSFSAQEVYIPIRVVNRSTHDPVFLDFYLYIPLSNGEELQVTDVAFAGVALRQRLGPGEYVLGRLHCRLTPPGDGSIPFYDKAYLRIIDQISGRSLKVGIPGIDPVDSIDKSLSVI